MTRFAAENAASRHVPVLIVEANFLGTGRGVQGLRAHPLQDRFCAWFTPARALGLPLPSGTVSFRRTFPCATCREHRRGIRTSPPALPLRSARALYVGRDAQ